MFGWLARIREEQQVGIVKGLGVPWENVARLGGMVASGLFYLHEEGFTFGDLKSLNVLLTDGAAVRGKGGKIGDGVRVKLCDFGLSRRLRQGSGTQKGFAVVGKGPVGTLAYLAPEAFGGQVRNPERAKAVDIYALGVVLYELCTQLGPWIWEGIRMEQLEDLVLREGKRPSWPCDRKVPAKLKMLIERCWHQDPAMRPPIKDVVFDLDQMQTEFAAMQEDENDELDRVCKEVMGRDQPQPNEEVTSLTESIDNELLSGTFLLDNFGDTVAPVDEMHQEELEDEIANVFQSSMRISGSQNTNHAVRVPPTIKTRGSGGSSLSSDTITPSAARAHPLVSPRKILEANDSAVKADEEMRRISSDITTEDTIGLLDQMQEQNSSQLSSSPLRQSPVGQGPRRRRPLSVQDVEAELADFENAELDQLSMQKVGVRVITPEEWRALGCR